MFYEVFDDLCKQKGESPNAVAKKLCVASGTVTEWKKGRVPRNSTLSKIADYFGVSTDYLLGKEDNQSAKSVTDDDLKVALFGGDSDVTDEMWEEVKSFAQFVKNKGKKK